MFEINALNIIRYEVRDIGKKGVNANNRIAGRMDIVFKDIEKEVDHLVNLTSEHINKYDKSDLLLLNDLKKHSRKIQRVISKYIKT